MTPEPKYRLKLVGEREQRYAYEMEHHAHVVRVQLRRPQRAIVDEDARTSYPAPPAFEWKQFPYRRVVEITELNQAA